MRKFLFFFLGVFTFFCMTTLTSCGNKKAKPTSVTILLDTTVTSTMPITAPRWDCNGKLLPEPKLVGVDIHEHKIQLTKTLTVDENNNISISDDLGAGTPTIVEPYPVQPVYKPSFWEYSWFPYIVGMLLFLISIALIFLFLLFLYHLLRYLLNDKKENTTTKNETPSPSPAPVASPTVSEVPKEAESSKNIEIVFHENGIMKSLKIK